MLYNFHISQLFDAWFILQPVPKNEHCGPEFHYVVSVKSSGNWSTLSTTTVDSSTEIQIGPNETHIRILAKNKEGISPEQQDVVRIPCMSSTSFFTIKNTSTEVL